MKTTRVYFKLQLKKASKIVPYYLTGVIALALLLGAITFLTGKAVYGDAAVGRTAVGVALPEDDVVAKKALAMISSLDSVKSLCDFQYMKEQQGREALQAGRIHALMLVPDNLIGDIIQGVNTPVTLVLPGEAGLESMVIKALTEAGAKVLSTSQAAIYAGDEFLLRHGLEGEIHGLEADINRLYLQYALPRADYFRPYQVDAGGDVPVAVSTGAGLFVLYLFLCGIPAFALLKPEKEVLLKKLELAGVRRPAVIAAKVLTAGCLLLLSSALAGGAAAVSELVSWSAPSVLIMLAVSLSAAAVIVWIYELAGSPAAGVMLLFWLSVGLVFLSGGFVPSVFLPEGLQRLAVFMPSTWFIQAVKGVVTGVPAWPAAGAVCAVGAVSYLGAVVSRRSYG